MGAYVFEPAKAWRREEKAGIMPPELNEVTRPLAVPSPQSCEGAVSAGLPPPRLRDVGGGGVRPTDCQSVAAGSGENGNAVVAASTSLPKFLIAPDLREVFAEVGATDKAYTFKEILGFLKAYLYSKRYLFDSEDILYVNCKDDNLGDAFQCDRFHYTEVRGLIARNVIPVGPVGNGINQVRPIDGSVNGIHPALLVSPVPTTGISHGGASSVPQNGCVNPLPYFNGKTVTGASSFAGSSNQTVHQELRRQNTYPFSSVPSSSRQSSAHSTVTIEFQFPDVPDCNSDSESVYSYQGYETALCRNTEFEDSDVSEEIEYEEYELASDDNEGQDDEHSDDSDSVIEDVKVALLAVQAVYEDEIEEEFWADDSDTDEQSTDEDPELAHEKWDCLSCGIKNKPFVRYCGKCWQLRKNWLPERPKKKRKPRPKKKLRKRYDSLMSEASVKCYKESETCGESGRDSPSPALVRESSADSGLETGDLVRSSSTATTVSLESNLPRSCSFDVFSSQDSGISLSQDIFTEISQDTVMEDSEAKASSSRTVREPSCHKVSGVGGSSSSASPPTIKERGREQQPEKSVIGESSKRKRKSSSKDDHKSKRSKTSHSPDLDEKPQGLADEASEIESKLTYYLMKYIRSQRRETTCVPNEGEIKKDFKKLLDKYTGYESGGEESQMCMICCSRPKNAIITHGRLSHQATCYQCARRLLNSGARCPVCRRKIHMVCKNIVV
ncbi:E3 ubiquitin-protein ligase Mdm2-like isoform X1 [Palaemon carinicauda]|uniref:E3 ubiquitin-protein ligase Mdm2-like isoform X1 n=2 Tax=Palaemon carinicauda TaxID=392227 RepID=UPI0035B5EC47